MSWPAEVSVPNFKRLQHSEGLLQNASSDAGFDKLKCWVGLECRNKWFLKDRGSDTSEGGTTNVLKSVFLVEEGRRSIAV
jgi:hypothetical protein